MIITPRIYYVLSTEGTDEEVCARLREVRERILALPGGKCSELIRVDPVCNAENLRRLQDEGTVLPSAVRERLEPLWADPEAGLRADGLAGLDGPADDRTLLQRFAAIGWALVQASPHWCKEDYPESLRISGVKPEAIRLIKRRLRRITDVRLEFPPLDEDGGSGGMLLSRDNLFVEFANAMHRYGHLLEVDFGAGCDPMSVGLTTYAGEGRRLWLGRGQFDYAFAENARAAVMGSAQVLDIFQDAGMLAGTDDSLGYYGDRDWDKAALSLVAVLISAGEVADTLQRAKRVALYDMPDTHIWNPFPPRDKIHELTHSLLYDLTPQDLRPTIAETLQIPGRIGELMIRGGPDRLHPEPGKKLR